MSDHLTEQELEAIPTRHYLVSLTAKGPTEPEGDALAHALSKAIGSVGLLPMMARAYTSTYSVNPTDVGLKDAWLQIPPDARVILGREYPSLVASIIFLTGMGEDG